MLRRVEQDARTVIGRNLRSILMLSDAGSVEVLRPAALDNGIYYGGPVSLRHHGDEGMTDGAPKRMEDG